MTSAETVVPNEVTFTGTKVSTSTYLKKYFFNLFIWLCQVLVAT